MSLWLNPCLGILVVALLVWVPIGIWLLYRFLFDQDHVRCSRCGAYEPKWFTEAFSTGEVICSNCSQHLPRPLARESENAYVARWEQNGRPRGRE